jgi:C4-dicarboxylate transporter, DctM subunit
MALTYGSIVVVLFILLFAGLPIAFVLGSLGVGTMISGLGPDIAFSNIPMLAYGSVDSFGLIALPCFVLTGELLLRSGTGEHIYNAVDKWVRHLPGGLAIASVIVCAFFASIAGSSVATALTFGALATNHMISKGYSPKMAYSIMAAGGTLGILIPPSGVMIIFSGITETSTLRLFTAGIVPGILLALLFIVYILFATHKKVERQPSASWEERWQSSRHALWGILIPITLFVGMYSGVFTVTEAAAMSVIVTLLVGIFAYKGITRKNIISIVAESAATSSMILFIVVGGILFGSALTLINLPTMISNFISGLDFPWYAIVLTMIAILIVLGMFLETISIVLITVPVFYPVLVSLGLDPIWIGIIYVIIIEMALITPPVGINLFVMASVAEKEKVPLDSMRIGKASLPYVGCMLLFSLVILIFPEIVLWLPELIYGK